MEVLGWRRQRESSSAARRGARQRAGLTPAAASNTLPCQRKMLHQKNPLDSDHGIYREAMSQRVVAPPLATQRLDEWRLWLSLRWRGGRGSRLSGTPQITDPC